MITPALVLTPFSGFAAPAIELANQLWRKRVLPVGDVEYNGRMPHFDPAYIAQLASAYNANAYDQVSFQLADARNTHTNDPERHRGEIVGLSAEPDGLWVTLRPTEQGHRILMANPKLGVSARIVENYARSDGKFFPAAVQHVLGTLDPRIPGLGAWEPVAELSNAYAPTVIDLSGRRFEGEPAPDPAPEFSPDELAALAEAEAEYAADQAAGLSAGYADFDATFTERAGAEQARARARELADLADIAHPARSDEDRLARGLARLQAGVYDPAPGFTFAHPTQDAVQLANEQTAITGRGPCGAVDDFGRCSARHHALKCSHSGLPDHAAVRESGVHEAALSNFGRLAELGTPSGPTIRDFGDPYGESVYAIPEHVVELAHRVAGDAGLLTGGWEDLLGSPDTQTNAYQALAFEIGEGPRPETASDPARRDVSGLAQQLGLRR